MLHFADRQSAAEDNGEHPIDLGSTPMSGSTCGALGNSRISHIYLAFHGSRARPATFCIKIGAITIHCDFARRGRPGERDACLWAERQSNAAYIRAGRAPNVASPVLAVVLAAGGLGRGGRAARPPSCSTPSRLKRHEFHQRVRRADTAFTARPSKCRNPVMTNFHL